MGFAALKCPECGADIDIDDSREYAFCSYCGTKLTREKMRIEVSVKGIAGADSLLQRAFIFLEDGDFGSAAQYIERVLDLDPRCAKAYIGKFMVEHKLRRMEAIGTMEPYIGNNSDFRRALEFSSGEEQEYYQRFAAKNLEAYRQKQDRYRRVRDGISQKIDKLDRVKIILILVAAGSAVLFVALAMLIGSPMPGIVQAFSMILFLTAAVSGIILVLITKKRTSLFVEMSKIDYELNKLDS